MFVMGYLMEAIGNILDWVLGIYMWIILARAVLSWVNPDPYNPIVKFIYNITEPVLKQIRAKLPAIQGVDISPIIVFFVIYLIQNVVCRSLITFAHKLM